jgi:hypothetical protein
LVKLLCSLFSSFRNWKHMSSCLVSCGV